MLAETENPPAQNVLVPSKKIVDGIAALKRVTKWPKKGAKDIPSYVDESATIYLEFTPKKILDSHRPGPRGQVILPHPLSYKRDVCFIARGLDHEEQRADVVDVLKAIGIKGVIKMIPLDDVQAAIANKDIAELKTLAQHFDSYLIDRRASKTIEPLLVPALDENGHYFSKVNSKVGRKQALSEALATSSFLLNDSKDCYALKVAHTGHTDVEIEENIQRALDNITKNRPGMFLGSWKHFKCIHLKTGDSKGVPIYVNDKDGEVEERFHAEPDITLSSEAIVTGIAALKEIAACPKLGKMGATPLYSDESTIISLELTPKEMQRDHKPGTLGCLILPHALSYRRRVCFVAPDALEKDEEQAMKAVLKELGIQKNITVVRQSFLEAATRKQNVHLLNEFAKKHDTYLIDVTLPRGLHHSLKCILGGHGKRLSEVCFGLQQKKGFQTALAKTALLINPSKDGYVMKVAHVGFTETQIKENIQDALNYIYKFRARLFPGGLKHFRSIHLKAGDSARIAIYVDDEPDEINDGISELKKVAAWPKKGETKTTPAYSDESSTIYLEFIPTKMFNAYKPGYRGSVVLPHPLSYNRNVCFIYPSEMGPLETEIEDTLTTLGVKGKIQMIPKHVVCESIEDNDQGGLVTLTQLFDTHLMTSATMLELELGLRTAMYEHRKFLCPINTDDRLANRLKAGLARSPLLVNSSKDGYELKIAHTGHTDIQIKENIRQALEFLKPSPKKMYAKELKNLKLINLKTGDSERVAIYVNDTFVKTETTPRSATLDQKPKPTAHTASTASPKDNAAASTSSGENANLKRKSMVDAPLEAPQAKKRCSSMDFATRWTKLSISAATPPTVNRRNRRVRKRMAALQHYKKRKAKAVA